MTRMSYEAAHAIVRDAVDGVRLNELRPEHWPAREMFRAAVLTNLFEREVAKAFEGYGYQVQLRSHALVVEQRAWDENHAMMPPPTESRQGDGHVVVFYGDGWPSMLKPPDSYPELELFDGAFPHEYLLPSDSRIQLGDRLGGRLRYIRDGWLIACLMARHRIIMRTADVTSAVFCHEPTGHLVLVDGTMGRASRKDDT